jgi:hypothetical protein
VHGSADEIGKAAVRQVKTGVLDGGAEADLAGVVRLPVLEAPDVAADLVTAGAGPGRGVQVTDSMSQPMR